MGQAIYFIKSTDSTANLIDTPRNNLIWVSYGLGKLTHEINHHSIVEYSYNFHFLYRLLYSISFCEYFTNLSIHFNIEGNINGNFDCSSFSLPIINSAPMYIPENTVYMSGCLSSTLLYNAIQCQILFQSGAINLHSQ